MYFNCDNPFGTEATRPAGGDIVKHLTPATQMTRPRKRIQAPSLLDLTKKLILL